MPPTTARQQSKPLASQATAPTGYHGRAFVYVLASAGAEDLLKVGLTHDPLQRWSSFHTRWFEAFDLPHSLLIETETRGDAQRLETTLHRELVEHNCPAPLTMRLMAGGGTEWYRNAYPRLQRFAETCRASGFVVHGNAHAWLQATMEELKGDLHALLLQADEDGTLGSLPSTLLQQLQDLLDAHTYFDSTLIGDLPMDALERLGLRA